MKKQVLALLAGFMSLGAMAQQNAAPIDTTIWKEVALGEVVIKSHLPATRQINGGTSTTIVGSTLSKVGNAENVIEHLAGVHKNLDGSFELTGHGTPDVYIDGQKVRDLATLRRLRSDNIKNIEVFTTPGAKYNAATGSVINIKTRGKEDGLNLEASSEWDYHKEWSNAQQLSLDYQKGKDEVFVTGRYANSRGKEYGVSDLATQITLCDWRQDATTHDHNKHETWYGQVGYSHQFSADNSIGAMYELTATTYAVVNSVNTTCVFLNNQPYDHLLTHDDTFGDPSPMHHANAYFTGKWGKLGIDFNADLLMSKGRETESVKESSDLSDFKTLTSFSANRNRMYAGRLIFSYPIWKGDISFGSEYTHTRRTSSSTGYGNIISATDDKVTDRNLAGFVDYSFRAGVTSASAGLRYEHVTYRFFENGVYDGKTSKQYNNFFPTLSLSTLVGNTRLALGYQVRTIRPLYQMLSSATNYGNAYTYLAGSPALQPTYIHTADISASWKDLRGGITFNHYKDDMFFMVHQMEGNPTITVSDIENQPNRNELVTSFSYTPSIGLWKPELTVMANTQWLRADGKNMNGTVMHVQWNNAFSLPHNWLVRVDANIDGSGYSQNRKMKSGGSLNASISHDFLNNRLRFVIEGTDLLHTLREGYQLDYLYRQTKQNSRGVKLTLSYRLNGKDKKYKGTGAGNDEMRRF